MKLIVEPKQKLNAQKMKQNGNYQLFNSMALSVIMKWMHLKINYLKTSLRAIQISEIAQGVDATANKRITQKVEYTVDYVLEKTKKLNTVSIVLSHGKIWQAQQNVEILIVTLKLF